ncbi:class I SAM-dependent methyltransferase [Desulfofustis limnaeus]|jgi:ubiquinone/menaquinone biosynthesis C-methylase UbiE|uniref:Fibrillarin-like rRNA methylase n=1 Tax=Desulfofustis limnaeus TaxID=2740163 RepID=A0ABN6M5Y8_9BACT|nr:class I SAM-dependent methyltransferase [Desulfofustis limnaeus]MDX9896658.1 class I SAM-dependent methyltransferase [Desulfofustis sp.]BDD88235.1 fibrillarin-like rRNA methylase [Desulfofustis limnaeus]
MHEKKFDPKKLEKLNNPKRLLDIPPKFIGAKLGIEAVQTVVEIGAGTGFYSVAFWELYHPARLYACDVSETMLDWVRDHVVPRYPGIIPVKTEENVVPLSDGGVDLVFMINLHHELDQPPLILRESYRLLKPGGVLFIVDWKKEEMNEGPPSSIRCTPDQVVGDLEQAGFRDAIIHHDLEKHFLIISKKAIPGQRP